MVSERGTGTQQCLLALLEKWEVAVDKGKVFGTLLTDLSKTFDCLNHELLIVKLKVHGFTLPALKLVHDYLSDRKQGTRVNNSCSTFLEYLKVLYLVHYYLTYFWRIYFSF